MNSLIKDVINNIKIEFKNDENNNKLLNGECIFNFSLPNLKKVENENNIYYPNNFYIINKQIFKKMCEYNIINKDYNKEKKK